MDLDQLNNTELWELARLELSSSWGKPIRLKRSVPRERVIELIESGECPRQDELLVLDEPKTPDERLVVEQTDTRRRLEEWIKKNWALVNSQLPCTGNLKGRCTVYPCAEGRHFDCFLQARKHFI